MIFLLAWLMAVTIGMAIWSLAQGAPRRVDDAMAAIGYAVPIGLLACALVVRLPSSQGYAELPPSLWGWPAILLPPLVVLVWWRLRAHAPLSSGPIATSTTPRWAVGACLVGVAALIAVRAFWLYEEAVLRPLFGWDAWLAWSAKAKAWALSGQAVPFVDAKTWLAEPAGTTRTSLAYNYPEWLSWLQVWLSRTAGDWSEPAINIAWPTLWLALLAGCYGQWRSFAVPVLPAIVGTYLLASLPLANVHAALPGYADLWVATVFVFAVLAILRWREHGQRSQLLMALILTAALPGLKLEGMVWATSAIALILWFALARYGRTTRIVGTLACVLGLVTLSWLLGLSWFDQALKLFSGQGHDGHVVDVLTSTGAGLFTQDNWHLLWYLLPLVVIWRWRQIRQSPSLTGLLLLLAGGLALLMVLFVCTPAGRWAESFTAVNRLVLHLAPIAVSAILLALREPARERPAPAMTSAHE